MRKELAPIKLNDKLNIKNNWLGDFPGGTVVKNLPANNAGNTVRALVREDPTYLGATKPERHNYWALAPGALLRNKRSHCSEKPVYHNQE